MSDSGSGFDSWEDIPTEPAAPAAAAPITPTEPAAPAAATVAAPEELVYSTVLNEDDMHLLEMGGERAMFTPRDIRQYIDDYINPPQPRGGSRNHKYVPIEDPHAERTAPVTNKNFADSELFDECREVLSRQPLYMRRSRDAQRKMLVNFVRLCERYSQRAVAGMEGAKQERNFNCKLYLDEFMAPYSQKGSLLQGKRY